jgi:hypothetical protein
VNGFGVGKELGELFERIRQRDRADADEEERVRSVFSRITFGPALEPYIARLSVRLGPGEGPWAMFFLVATITTNHRDTGNAGPVNKSLAFTARSIQTIDDATRMARSLLKDILCHEVDEAIMVDGVRVFDPHREEKP